MATALAKTGGEKVGFIENTAMRQRGGPFKKTKNVIPRNSKQSIFP
jgi:hypothetical protein